MTNTEMPERIWLQGGEKTHLGMVLRKWDSNPFDAGTAYIRADLANVQPAASVDVDALKKDYCACDNCNGWNACIDHLAATGRLNPQPNVPQDVLQLLSETLNEYRLLGAGNCKIGKALAHMNLQALTALAPFIKGDQS